MASVRSVSRDEVLSLMRRGAQVVDVLSSREHEHARLPGAVSIPLARLTGGALAALDRAAPVVVYCHDTT